MLPLKKCPGELKAASTGKIISHVWWSDSSIHIPHGEPRLRMSFAQRIASAAPLRLVADFFGMTRYSQQRTAFNLRFLRRHVLLSGTRGGSFGEQNHTRGRRNSGAQGCAAEGCCHSTQQGQALGAAPRQAQIVRTSRCGRATRGRGRDRIPSAGMRVCGCNHLPDAWAAKGGAVLAHASGSASKLPSDEGRRRRRVAVVWSGGQAPQPSAGEVVPDQCRPPRGPAAQTPSNAHGQGADDKGGVRAKELSPSNPRVARCSSWIIRRRNYR